MHNLSHLSQIEKESTPVQPGRIHAGLGRQTVTGRISGAVLQLRRYIHRNIW